VGSTLYFSAGGQLWKYDGSNLTEIPVGNSSSPNAGELTAVGSTLYFTAYDGTGTQLWEYDGSSLTEVKVATDAFQFPSSLTALGSTLYFNAGGQLWKYDGSNLTEIPVGNSSNPNPYDLTAVGRTLYFAASDGTGTQLWKYDGSNLTEIPVGNSSNPNPGGLTAVGSTLYFAAYDGTANRQLWQYDGSAVTEVPINPNGPSNPQNLSAVGNTLYLSADDGAHGLEPWVVTDTTTASTPTVTVSAAGGTFNGSPFAATATVNGGSSLEGVSPTLTYYAGSSAAGTPLAGAPVSAGTYTVVASFAGSTDYTSASSAPLTFTIGKATLTVTADNRSRLYGAPDPSFTASYSGFQNGETLASSGVAGAPDLSSSDTTASPVGTYTITAAAGTLSAANYTFAFAGGTLAVTPAPLTITANNQSMVYGGSLPALTASYSGLVNGDGPSAISGLTLATVPATSHAGSYAITASGASDPDYAISYQQGTLTVTPAALTITADNQSMVYGGSLPALTASYSGLVNGNGPSAVSGLTLATVPATSHAGTYAITASGASDPDYAITLVNGTLTIRPAPLTITADGKTKVYGAALPALTASYSGLVNGDTPASLDTRPTLSTTASAGSHAGSYAISAAAAADPDYSIAYVGGTSPSPPRP
jgi:ELWxxDGT repeat protein